MAILDPTLVIACNYTPTRRALITLLTDRFPRANVRLVFDAAHLLLAEHMRIDAVFVDATTHPERLRALQDALGPPPVLVCAPLVSSSDDSLPAHGASLHSALPTLCSMFPLSAPGAVLELERMLIGRVRPPNPVQIVSVPRTARRSAIA